MTRRRDMALAFDAVHIETGSPMIHDANASTPELAELAVLEKAARATDRELAALRVG